MRFTPIGAAPFLLVLVTAGCARNPTFCDDPSPPVSLALTPAGDTIAVGQAFNLHAATYHVQGECTGRPVEVPERRPVSWRVLDPAVAALRATTDSSATVAGVGLGTTVVVATDVSYPAVQAGIEVRVQAQ